MYYHFNLVSTRLVFVIVFANSLFNVVQAEELPTVVALFGDSITEGYNADFAPNIGDGNGSTTKGRPTIELNRLMAAEPKRDVIVANYGVGGSSSAYGNNRIYSVLSDNKSEFSGKKYYVLILYGTNDPGHGISSSATGFNIDNIIRRSQRRGYGAIVGTIPPRSDQSVSSRNAQIISKANSRGAPLVDINSRFGSNYKGTLIDSESSYLTGAQIYLHPNKAGYKAIAKAWFDDELAARIDPIPEPAIVMEPIYYLLLDN